MKTKRSFYCLLVVLLVSLVLAACGRQPSAPASSTDATTGTATLVLPGHDKATTVTYEIVDGQAIFEEDIILGNVDAQGNLTSELTAQGVAIDKQAYRWPGAVVPYVISGSLSSTMQANINAAIAHWENSTIVEFVPKTSSHTDYVSFVVGSGCSSWVGRQTLVQTINLSSGCSIGNVIHEIGHAIGLWHEQSREDRDSHVTINWQNIQPGTENNFAKHVADGFDLGSYDFVSIMHYPCTAFSTNGQNTITPINPPVGVGCNAAGVNKIGQRIALSAGDLSAVGKLYPTKIAFYGLSSSDYQKYFDLHLANGYRLKKVSGYEVAGSARFAAVWEHVSGPAWVARHNMTSSTYQTYFNTYTSQGYRLQWVSGYTVGGITYYAAIWDKAPGGAWVAFHGMTSSDYQTKFNTYLGLGYRLKMVNGYNVSGSARFAAIWEKVSGPSWVARHNMTSSTYQTYFNTYTSQGYRLVHVSGYSVGGVAYYAALWDKSSGPSWGARHGMSSTSFQSYINSFINSGYKVSDVSGYSINGVPYYAALWEK
jgi:Astacin (Peptidase family M12A)/Bacterial tandem repeat domain 1